MTRPAAVERRRRRGRRGRRASWRSTTSCWLARLALLELLPDAQDRAQAGVDGAAELAADELVGLGGVAPALGVADDDPVASPTSIGAETSPVYAPWSS